MLLNKNIFKIIISILVFITSLQSTYAADFYWKSTGRTSQIFTDIGNWETAPGSGLVPNGGVAPGSNDNVFFPAGNLVQSIAIPSSGATCRNLTILAGGVITFTGSGNLSIYGDFTSNGNLMISNSSTTFLGAGNQTINMGDANIHSTSTNTMFFSGAGSYTLLSDFNVASRIEVSNSSFNANGFTVTCGLFYINTPTSGSKTINFQNSKLTVSSGASTTSITGGLVFNAATSSTTYNFNNAEILMDQKQKDCTLSATFEGFGTTITGLKSLTFKESSPNLVQNDIYNDFSFTIGVTDLNINVTSFNLQTNNSNLNVTNLNFLQPVYYSTTAVHNLNVNNINEFNSCAGQSFMTSVGSTNINFIANSPITTTNIAFKRVVFSNNNVSMPVQNDLGQNSGTYTTTTTTPSKSFYWVGGTGDWNDPTKWSLIGSGGTAQTSTGCLPSLNDDVYFDTNSFSATSTVTISGNGKGVANVRNIYWTDPNLRGNLTSGVININGSADFAGISNVTSTIYFIGKENNHTVKSGSSLVYNSPSVNFSGMGTYKLLNNFNASNNTTFNVYSGTFSTLGNSISALAFESRSLPNTDDNLRNIDISNSTLSFSSKNNNPAAFYLITSRLISFNATGSTINITGKDGVFNVIGSSGSEPKTNTTNFNNINFTEGTGSPRMSSSVLNFSANIVTFASNGAISSSNNTAGATHIVNIYNLTPAKIYTFTPNTNVVYTITNAINSNSIGVCSPKVTITSANAGTAAKLSKTSAPFTINNAIVKDINSINTTLTVTGGQDLGNNTNVVITPSPSQTFYWVGGTGNWNDASHWSIGVSGGNPTVTNTNNCVPSTTDDVFFDGNSFTANNQKVTIDGNAFFRNMTWNPAVNSKTPELTGNGSSILNAFGSVTFASNMTSTFVGTLQMRGNVLTTNANSITTNGFLLKSGILFNGGGRYDILDNLTTNSTFELASGQLFTNGKDVITRTVKLTVTGTNKADVSNSKITATTKSNGVSFTINHGQPQNWIATGSTLSSLASDAEVLILGATTQIAYNKIIIGTVSSNATGVLSANNAVVNEVTFISPTNSTSGNTTIGTLTVPTASKNTLATNQTVTITNQIIANGTPCNFTEFKSSTSGTQAIISSANCNLDLKFVRLTDIKAGTCTAAQNKVIGDNVSNNTNFTFLNINNVEYLGADVTLACNQFPYTLNTTGFGTNALSYVWGDGSTGSTLIVNGPGTYSVTVNYGNDCTLTDEIVIGLASSVVLNPATLEKCGNALNEGAFNLTDANVLLVANPANYTFTYYATSADASAATNPIANTYVSITKSVYVRAVEIAGGCFSTGEVKLNVTSTTAPTAASTQVICATGTNTIANILITGTNVKWYADNVSASTIPTTTILVSGTTYYATQTLVGTCESARVPVKVILDNCVLANPSLRSRASN